VDRASSGHIEKLTAHPGVTVSIPGGGDEKKKDYACFNCAPTIYNSLGLGFISFRGVGGVKNVLGETNSHGDAINAEPKNSQGISL
jgi:hypothetical protein